MRGQAFGYSPLASSRLFDRRSGFLDRSSEHTGNSSDEVGVWRADSYPTVYAVVGHLGYGRSLPHVVPELVRSRVAAPRWWEQLGLRPAGPGAERREPSLNRDEAWLGLLGSMLPMQILVPPDTPTSSASASWVKPAPRRACARRCPLRSVWVTGLPVLRCIGSARPVMHRDRRLSVLAQLYLLGGSNPRARSVWPAGRGNSSGNLRAPSSLVA